MYNLKTLLKGSMVFNNLLAEISKNNLNIENMAKIMNISSELLNKKIKGEINFKIEECLQMQQYLHCENISLDYLFKDRLC